MLDPHQSLAHLVLDHSESAEVLQRHHIDYCCRGERTLEAAAEEKGLEPAMLLQELSQAISNRHARAQPDPRCLSTRALIDQLVTQDHAALRRALPLVHNLVARVRRVHGDENPKLIELEAAVQELTEAMLPHLREEEERLFPALIEPHVDASEIAHLFAAMVNDHREVASILERIRQASDDYAVPSWGCASYHTLCRELQWLENTIVNHVHLENHVLLPRFADA